MVNTLSQHVFKSESIAVTDEEVREIEEKYDHKCDFCKTRFKTRKDILIHRVRCQHNNTTMIRQMKCMRSKTSSQHLVIKTQGGTR